MAGNCENWREVIEPLARRHTVIAPDLPGHGAPAPGAATTRWAASPPALRDLLLALGHERATLVGHSLGGGIAMQFSYQFPEMVERLVLVSSGGLGPEVSPVLRAAALPGADLFIAATAGTGQKSAGAIGRGLSAVGMKPAADVAEVARGYASLAEPRPPQGLPRHPARGRRHRGPAGRRRRPPLPGRGAAGADRLGRPRPDHPGRPRRRRPRALPGSKLEIFEGVGHMPQIEQPGRFVAVLERFLAETEPARFDREEWRARFKVA